jgi:TolB-like protein/DNA-binding winged helix-turn-helix (wHTH) protein
MNDSANATPTAVLSFGPFRADGFARTLVHETDGLIGLTPKQFDTLYLLLNHPGEVLDKERILAEVWAGSVVEDNNLSQAISALRKALGDDGETHRYILTVPRKGYRFVAEVSNVHTHTEAHALLPSNGTPAAAPAALIRATQSAMSSPNPAPSRAGRSRGAWLIVIALAIAGIAATAVWKSRSARDAGEPSERSVAILPFTNLSSEKDDEFFSVGMTEDLVTQLAQVSGLKVISHSFSGETEAKADRELAKRLGTEHFLQGTVRRSEQRFRINAQLIDAATGKHLWAKAYDRPIKDILIVQSEVATEIAEALRAVLLPKERDILARHADGNPDLYLLYKQGMYLISAGRRFNNADRDRGVKLLERVVALDPNSPLGHAGLAAYHLRTPNWRLATHAEAFAKAEAHVQRALDNAPLSPEALMIKAEIVARAHWRWKEADALSAKAVALSPGLADAWSIRARFGLEPNGKPEEALEAARKAVALEPLNPALRYAVVAILKNMERCDEAVAEAKQNLTLNPAYGLNAIVMQLCHEQTGRFREAVAVARDLNTNLPWLPAEALDELDAAIAAQGAQGYWRTRLKWAQWWDRQDPHGKYHLAGYAAQTGDFDLAFATLDQAIKERNIYLPGLKIEPLFKPLRSDPRWATVMRRMNFD